jgi:hypothetical protein
MSKLKIASSRDVECVTYYGEVAGDGSVRGRIVSGRAALLGVAVILFLPGVVFTGQGLGYIPGSFMTGSRFWAVVGILLLLTSGGLAVLAARRGGGG